MALGHGLEGFGAPVFPVFGEQAWLTDTVHTGQGADRTVSFQISEPLRVRL